MVYSRTAVAPVVVLAIGLASIEASSVRFFQAQSQADFLQGDIEDLSLDSRGHLRLGSATDLVYETAAPFLWAMTPGPDGSLFVGTGNEGRVFRIDDRGRGSVFFDAEELEAHAIATTPDGDLLVGTSPNGRVYKVSSNGESVVFFDPAQQYIWALAVTPEGVVYAATGNQGTVYRIEPDGRGAPFYEAPVSNVTSLALDASGTLFIGTESPGQVIRVDAEGRGFVLLDSPFREVRTLKFDAEGRLYVAAVNPSPDPTSPAPRPAPSAQPPPSQPASAPVPTVTVSTEITAVVVDSQSGSGPPAPREIRGSPRGAIYRIEPDGLWDQLWESRQDSPYDLAFDEERRLIVGTGGEGKIYRLDGDPLRASLIATADAQQVTSLHRDAEGRISYATANPGKVYRLAAEQSATGTYQSPPFDATVVSSWGSISWRGIVPEEGRVEVSTRSGNTPVPDDAWSAWSPPYAAANGSPITSPNARYLQWRVTLKGTGESPTLRSVSAAYLQRNLRPLVRSITVHPPGIVFQKPFSSSDPDLAGFENQTTPERTLTAEAMGSQQGNGGTPSLGRRTYQKGLQTLVWSADDPNEDSLTFDVLYRREDEATWKVLRRELTESIHAWDTTTVPNGTYFVRVVASDSPSNARSLALNGELDSIAFEVDNTPPVVFIESVNQVSDGVSVTFEVRDDHSPVQSVEYSTDGQRWQAMFPADGIADSQTERYALTLEGPLSSRGLTIRALDAMNNGAAAQVEGSGR